VVDYRGASDPLIKINQLQTQEQLNIWGEAGVNLKIPCLDRYSLQPAELLVIWTIPPGPNEIRSVLEFVKPTRVYLFAINPGMDEPGAFLNRMVGLLKNRIKSHHGIANLRSLAAATSQRMQTITVGLDWLEVNGYIHMISSQDDEAHIEVGNMEKKENTKAVSSQLNALLTESAAYRRYYLSTDKDRLIQYDEE
jgi:single-stranded-DNA-specific exonuclease